MWDSLSHLDDLLRLMSFVGVADVVPQFLAEESSICLAHNPKH